jgi:hypothetical protein
MAVRNVCTTWRCQDPGCSKLFLRKANVPVHRVVCPRCHGSVKAEKARSSPVSGDAHGDVGLELLLEAQR